MKLSPADIATALANGGSLSKSVAESLVGQPLAAPPPAPEKPKRGRILTNDGQMFLRLCTAHDLPEPIPELRFKPERKWRFDWAWLAPMVALEIQGGIWTKGRHTQGAALLREWEKLNEAAIMGWRILYCEPADVESGAVFEVLKRALR